ncbi:MAG: sugar-transfer associated ATP-grasp domain-containing protein, partial [Pseudomonadota bacterium]
EVFVKPLHGTGGIGAQAYRVDGIERLEALAATLREEAGARHEWLAQDRLRSHPDLRDVTLNALSTVRVYTILDENERAEVVSTSLKLATASEAIVDNGAGTGIHVGIDFETGRLKVGAGRGDLIKHSANPVNGVAFEGREMPRFREMVEIALRAHDEAFPDYTYAGWDLAATADGVFLIEGNPKASMVAAQRWFLRVMGPERFNDLVRLNMARVPKARR